MKNISAFDVIGPIMVGPSSSHTAGALRISAIVNKIANSKITKVSFVLFGSFATTYKGHGTDRALLGGILGYATDDERIRESLEIAKKQGIEYTFTPDFDTKTDHPNTISINAVTENGQVIDIIGESIGGGAMQIININGTTVNFTGEFNTIIIEQNDAHGVIKDISDVLTNENINIAFMRVFRDTKGGTAYTMIEVDEHINNAVSKKLLECKNINDVSIIYV